MKLRVTALSPSTFVALAALTALGCAQQSTTVDVRSLERSGKSAFVCLAAPSDAPGLPLTACTRATTSSVDDFGVDEAGNTTVPHLYALVTQTTRGEIAVVDLTTDTSAVLDQDPTTPGANFIPVGAQPVDIMSTAGGTATFVAVAEVGREGIFALPSTMIRPAADRPAPSLSSWPACSLPSAPGEVLILSDPAGPEGERASCDLPYGGQYEPATYTTADGQQKPLEVYNQHGDLRAEAAGRQKLLVTLPEEGGFVVIDAQRLLDRNAGSFAPCEIERWVPLRVELPPPGEPPAPPPALACVNPEPFTPEALPLAEPRPAGVALSGDRLYVADLAAPVIHAIDVPTPCEPVERAPLLPTSLDEPDRVVTTSRVAASQAATPELRRYLYAVDVDDASTMVFDISDGAAQRTPLRRAHPEWDPFQPPDRVKYNAPIRDIIVIERDVPAVDPETGVAVGGVRCDPNPLLDACSDASDQSCDPETLLRTSSTYDSGAGPLRLRGTFAFVLLTNGQIGVIDIDDLDAACRAPRSFSEREGCAAVGPSGFGPPSSAPPGDRDADGVPDAEDDCPYHYNPKVDGGQPGTEDDKQPDEDGDGIGDRCDGLATSGEASCNVVTPNAPRSTNYVITDEGIGLRSEPGLQLLPTLYDVAGAILSDGEDLPQMRAPIPPDFDPTTPATRALGVAVGSDVEVIDPIPVTQPGATPPEYVRAGQVEGEHALLINLEDPRAHVANQAWAVTYEGALPGFSDNRSELRCAEGCGLEDATLARWDLYDASGLFCANGVQSAESVREQLTAAGEDASDPAVAALADFVEITSEIPEETNAYWTNKPPECGGATYDICVNEYGNVIAPSPSREIMIREAYEDHLVLERPSLASSEAARAALSCCFPGTVQFQIRARSQWLVTSQANGFMHHVIADPASGVCRNSCDPSLARMNGRVRRASSSTPGCFVDAMGVPLRPYDTVICEGDPRVYTNPMLRFAITDGLRACTTNADCPGTPCDVPPGGTERRCLVPPQRDMQYRFASQGAFVPLVINLSTSTADIQPQSMRFVPTTGELAVTDGSLEGLLLISISSLDVNRQYY